MESTSFAREGHGVRATGLAARLLLLFLVAACGSDSPAGPGGGELPPSGASACTPLGFITGWQFARLGAGTKPAIAVGADGTVHATFLEEARGGWIRYASLSPGASAPVTELISNGYFYGPIDILLSDAGDPHVLYHDHDREDQVLAIRSGDDFVLQPMVNVGHDGWYNTGVFGPDNRLHTATYDPRGFAGRGLNYGVWDGASWSVELAAPGSFDYAGGTAIVNPSDGVHAAFFDDLAGLGMIASREGPNDWAVSIIEPKGDHIEVGRFPDMEVDPDGSALHLVYLALGGAGGDVVRYAKGTPGSFTPQDLATIANFEIGFGGARDLATLDLDPDGVAVVAFQTRSELTVMRVLPEGTETVAGFEAPSGTLYMQQTEIVVDDNGRTHLAWWQSGENPGTACYATLN